MSCVLGGRLSRAVAPPKSRPMSEGGSVHLCLWDPLCGLMSPPLISYLLVVHSSRVRLFATPGTVAHQASLSFTVSWCLLRLTSIESVMPSNRLILLPSSPPALTLPQHWDDTQASQLLAPPTFASGGAAPGDHVTSRVVVWGHSPLASRGLLSLEGGKHVSLDSTGMRNLHACLLPRSQWEGWR